MPGAPCSMPRRVSPRMRSTSAGSAGRGSQPTASARTALNPTWGTTLMPTRPSNMARYSSLSDHSQPSSGAPLNTSR